MKKNKLSLRPAIENIDASRSVSTQEVFQNQVLRPILKLQHDIIILLAGHAILRKGDTYEKLNQLEKEKYISTLLSKDITLANQLKGSILGMMTVDELNKYKSDEKNLSKRIISMMKKRILDSSDEVMTMKIVKL